MQNHAVIENSANFASIVRHSRRTKIDEKVVSNCEDSTFKNPRPLMISMQKRTLRLALCFALSFIYVSPGVAQTGKPVSRIRTIIIDAGHGGSDAGARGKYSTEAQITLELALKLEDVLKKEMADTRIVMTRRTDIFHHVTEKARIANSENGDLFVCIHVNAAPPRQHKELVKYKTVTYYTGKGKSRKKKTRKEPVYRYWSTPNPMHGTSTYIWAADRGDEKASGIQKDERYESELEVEDVPDPSSPEAIIKARLWTQKFFRNSVRLGTLIEGEFEKIGRKSLGVLQRNHKGIWVLQATNMPAVLIETGFITDADEEAYLNSESGQKEMVRSMADALISYKALVDSPKSNKVENDSSAPGAAKKPYKETNTAQKPTAVMPAGGTKKK
jgi:N-acetylmuramoyl-L-alanine amidase